MAAQQERPGSLYPRIVQRIEKWMDGYMKACVCTQSTQLFASQAIVQVRLELIYVGVI